MPQRFAWKKKLPHVKHALTNPVELVPLERRLWNNGNGDKFPPGIIFPRNADGQVWALYTKVQPPPVQCANVEHMKANDGTVWVQTGGQRFAQPEKPNEPRERRGKFGAHQEIRQYCNNEDDDWHIIMVHIPLAAADGAAAAAAAANISDNEEEDEQMEVDAVLEVGEELPDDDELFESRTFQNVKVMGKLTVLSDERSKSEIVNAFNLDDVPALVERVLQTDIKAYKQFGSDRVGFIAQNIQENFPKAVDQSGDGKYLTIDPMSLLATLWRTVQTMLLNDRSLASGSLLSMFAEERLQRTCFQLLEAEHEQWQRSETKPSKKGDVQNLVALGNQIAKELGERDAIQVKFVVEYVLKLGSSNALRLKQEAIEQSKTNGKKPGGNFFRLCKAHVERAKHDKVTRESGNDRKDLIPRDYQIKAVEDLGKSNAIVVLPTNMGKTLISNLVFRRCLEARPSSMVLFVTQDRKLALQQCEAFGRNPPAHFGGWNGSLLCCMGGNPIEEYSEHGMKSWKADLTSKNWNQIFGASQTGQTEVRGLFITAGALDSILSGQDSLTAATAGFNLSRISLVVFDETHHANEGEHKFTTIAKLFRDSYGKSHKAQFLGLTASPVSGTSCKDALRAKLRGLQGALMDAMIVVPEVSDQYKSQISHRVQMKVVRAYTTEKETQIVMRLEKLLSDLIFHARCEYPPHENIPSDYGERFVSWADEASAFCKGKGDMAGADSYYSLARLIETFLLVKDVGAVAAEQLFPLIVYMHVCRDHDREGLSIIIEAFAKDISPILQTSRDELNTRMEGVVRALLGSSVAEVGGASTQPQTLIRVATKAGAYWVAQRLQDQAIKAEAIVGRTNMNETQSTKVLDKFKQKEINVLVGTSLMEEGIDLSECDSVICFSVDRVLNSGKSLIQNSGRARKANSSFVVICTSRDDEVRYQQMQDQVRAMFDVVNDLSAKIEEFVIV